MDLSKKFIKHRNYANDYSSKRKNRKKTTGDDAMRLLRQYHPNLFI